MSILECKYLWLLSCHLHDMEGWGVRFSLPFQWFLRISGIQWEPCSYISGVLLKIQLIPSISLIRSFSSQSTLYFWERDVLAHSSTSVSTRFIEVVKLMQPFIFHSDWCIMFSLPYDWRFLMQVCISHPILPSAIRCISHLFDGWATLLLWYHLSSSKAKWCLWCL